MSFSFKMTIAIAMTLLFAPAEAEACTCVSPPSAIAALMSSQAVFEGVVVDIDPTESFVKSKEFEFGREQSRVTLKVIRAWKGVRVDQVAVVTDRGGASCGFHFQSGLRYLVYAKRFQGRLTTDICTRTIEATMAHGEFRDLGPARWQGAP